MSENMFTGVQTERIFEQIIKQIRKLIEDGVLKPGDRLPAERDLAESFGCSRASVREAFRVLELEGILVTKHGEGRFVQQVDKRMVMEFRFNPLDLLEKSAILSFLEAREILEPRIAELVAQRATEENIEQMESVLEKLAERVTHPDEEVNRENSFIFVMAEAAQNFVLFSMVESYLNMVRKVRAISLSSKNSEERYKASLQEHRAILDAIKNRDPEAAAKAVLIHLNNLKNNILND